MRAANIFFFRQTYNTCQMQHMNVMIEHGMSETQPGKQAWQGENTAEKNTQVFFAGPDTYLKLKGGTWFKKKSVICE
jgi:hypothetical protein